MQDRNHIKKKCSLETERKEAENTSFGSRTVAPQTIDPWMIVPRTIAFEDNSPQGKLPLIIVPQIIAPRKLPQR